MNKREIKFRAWDGKKIASELPAYLEPHDINETINSMKNEGMTLMQYTGLKDKNGKEIYEGDVVNVFDWGIKSSDRIIGTGVVEWSNEQMGWEIYSKSEGYIVEDRFDLFCKATFEVIGNIYENPELINS